MPTFEQFWEDLGKLAKSQEVIPRPRKPKNTYYRVLRISARSAVVQSGMTLSRFWLSREQFHLYWDALYHGTPSPQQAVKKDNFAPIKALSYYLHYAEPVDPHSWRTALDSEHWLFVNSNLEDAIQTEISASLRLESRTPYFSLIREDQEILVCQSDAVAGSLTVSGAGRILSVERIYRRYERKDPFHKQPKVQIRESVPDQCLVTIEELVRFPVLPSLERVVPSYVSQDQWSDSNEFRIVPLSPIEFNSVFNHIGSVSLTAEFQDTLQPVFEVPHTRCNDGFLNRRIDHLSRVNQENPLDPATTERPQRASDRCPGDLLKALYGQRCQVCGFTFPQNNGSLYSEIHHIQPKSEGGLDVKSNLIVVCPNHHKILDNGEDSYVDWTNKRVVLLGEPTKLVYDKHLFVADQTSS